ncbi:hypothetical protein Fot_13663 [Forsythia ovata]|uniref:Uncharacterized protein n=1 Tax=Forsythia ovata TaxID=205694 RepID=A0ABD1W7M0_9LAMI
MCSKFRLANPEEWRPSPIVRHPSKFGCGHSLYTLGQTFNGSPPCRPLPSNIIVAFQVLRGFEPSILRREPSCFTIAPCPWGVFATYLIEWFVTSLDFAANSIE